MDKSIDKNICNILIITVIPVSKTVLLDKNTVRVQSQATDTSGQDLHHRAMTALWSFVINVTKILQSSVFNNEWMDSEEARSLFWN